MNQQNRDIKMELKNTRYLRVRVSEKMHKYIRQRAVDESKTMQDIICKMLEDSLKVNKDEKKINE